MVPQLVIATLAVVLYLLVMRQPDAFSITRSALIPASPETIYAHVNDFRKWGAWSPWVQMDPQASLRFEGPESGVGSMCHWSGNSKVGKGSMTITGSEPADNIQIRLQFLKPMKATNRAIFIFTPEANGTRVSWTMSGINNFVGKAMNMVINCDKMLGSQFEQGLANLAQAVASGR